MKGVDYTLHTLEFPPRVRQPDFLKRNPLGTIPWFEHREELGRCATCSDERVLRHSSVRGRALTVSARYACWHRR